jgi:PAS domain S-box-containing protein
MIPIRSVMKRDFSKLSSSESVGSAVKVMEKMDVDYSVVEEEGEIRGIVTSRQLVGYPLSRLLLDCAIQPVSTITEGALADEALRVLEEEKASFLVVLNGEGIPVGITNRETIIDSLFQELEKLNREKDKYIAELRQAEEALRLSKESFHNIVNRNVDGVLIIDRKGIVHFVNPAVEAILGRKADELLGEMFGLPLVAGDASEIDTIRSSRELGVAEMRVIETEWEGENAYLASVRDITERRQAERDLMIKDNAIASSINAIAIADFDGSLTYVNPAFLRMWGYDSDREVLGKSISEFWPTEEQAQAATKTLYEKRSWQGELGKTRENGSEFYSQISISLVIDSDDRPIAIMASFIDLTERKRAEKRLWDSMSNFHKVINDNPDGIIITNREGIVRYVNPAAESLFGRKSEDFNGEQFGFPITSSDVTEVDITRRAGEIVVAEMRAAETMWYDEIAHLISLHDISERKRAEEKLRESEERYRDLFENANDLIQSVKPDGHFLYVNRAWRMALGYSEEEIPNLILWDIIHRDNLAHCQSIFQKVFSGEKVGNIDTVFLAKDGRSIIVEGDASCQFEGNKPAFTRGIFRDVTERKQAHQAQERLSQQLQAQVSELEAFSYGIAHDLRSPLVSIEGFSRLLREDLQNQKVENVQEDMRLLESGVKRMQGFLNSTLEYSRSGQMIKRTRDVSFGKIVKEVITEFNGQISSIGATVSTAKTFPKICVDRSRIAEVLANLIQNSIKYRDKTVPLKIEIGHYLSENETVFFVRDNGLGIDANEAEKVFALFYRSTADGEGSGIGLAIVKKIIEAHGGRIWVQQGQSGKGTTICFTLPQQNGTNKDGNNGKN